MSQTYRVELGAFDAKARSWNVELLSASHVRVAALEQAGAPLLDHLWAHTVGSPTIRWMGGDDEPPAGLVCVVKMKLPKAAVGGLVALGLVCAASLLGLALVSVRSAQEQTVTGFCKTELAAARLQVKGAYAESKSERVRSLAAELFTRGGMNYAKH